MILERLVYQLLPTSNRRDEKAAVDIVKRAIFVAPFILNVVDYEFYIRGNSVAY